jgi:hypothetical protein
MQGSCTLLPGTVVPALLHARRHLATTLLLHVLLLAIFVSPSPHNQDMKRKGEKMEQKRKRTPIF